MRWSARRLDSEHGCRHRGLQQSAHGSRSQSEESGHYVASLSRDFVSRIAALQPAPARRRGGHLLHGRHGACSTRDGAGLPDLLTIAAATILVYHVVAELSGLYRSWRGTRLRREIACVLLTWAYTVPVLLGHRPGDAVQRRLFVRIEADLDFRDARR